MPFTLTIEGERATMTGQARISREAADLGQESDADAHYVSRRYRRRGARRGQPRAVTIVAANTAAIARAADILRAGGLVAVPTETVYGLAADAANPQAIARVFAIKGRPRFHPLIVHVRDLDEALRHADLHDNAVALARRFWPGPLTLVAPRRAESSVCELACAGLASIALRAPAHRVARELLAAFGQPFAAPSANRSGRISPTTAAHGEAELGGAIDLISGTPG